MIRRIGYLIGFTALTLVAMFYVLAFQDYKARSQVPVSLPSFNLFADDMFWNKFAYVTAEGTWVFEKGDKANPLSTSRIDCIKSERVCRESQAYISTSGFSASPFLRVDRTTFSILKWDDSQIVYTDTDPACVFYLYTINRITKEVSGVRKTKANTDPKICESIEKQDMQLRLVDGYKVQSAEMEKVSSLNLVWATLIGALVVWLGGMYLIWKKTK